MTQFDQRYQQVDTQYNAGRDVNVYPQPLTLTEQQRRRNRAVMLDLVQSIWIDGVLEPSLHGASQIALELQHKPSAVITPWWVVLREFVQTGPLMPADTSIQQVYDQANGELLILGEPGSGKTTLLLELARDLLERARHNESHPIPVIFTLSSWATKRLPLSQWLVEELNAKYQIPRPLAASWIATDLVLPLLDGLDEVEEVHRAACVEAINVYRQAHGLLPTVVCSRQADYFALFTHVLLRTAVVVQPLSPQQIETYLISAGEPLAALCQALQEDADLQTLTSTPLMLTVLTLAYRGTPLSEIAPLGTLPAKQQQVFATYVKRMLTRRGPLKAGTAQQVEQWLTYLAAQMREHNQTVFYLEQMQPTWLSGNRMLGVYDWLAVRLPGVLMGMLVSLSTSVFIFSGFYLPLLITSILLGGLLGGLLSEGSTPQRPAVSGGKARSALGPHLLQWLLIGALIGLGSGLDYGELSNGLNLGLVFGPGNELSNGLSFGLSTGLCSILLQFLLRKNNTTEARFQTPPLAKGTIWQRLIRRREVHNGLLVGLIFGLSSGLSTMLSTMLSPVMIVSLSEALSDALSIGLGNGLSLGLSTGVLSVLLIGRSTVVQPMDLLVWSWRSLGKSLFSKSHASTTVQITVFVGLSAGLSAGLINGLSAGLSFGLSFGLSEALGFGLSTGLSCWLLLGLLQGVSGATIEDQRRVVPNQGIRHSALNGLVLGLISAVIVGGLGCLILGLSIGLSIGLGYALSIGPAFGLSDVLSGLSYGLPAGLLAGLSAGLLVGLLNGGLAALRHGILRLLLRRAGVVPRHYVRFLDEVASCILLQKVGGGYSFVHRLLLDYFAELEKHDHE